MATSYSPLPRVGDRVLIHDVQAKEAQFLNSQNGVISKFQLDQAARYEIQLEKKDETSKDSTALLPLSNITLELEEEKVSESEDQEDMIHVLIPSHVDSEETGVLFLRCIESVADQRTMSKFRVFISLSGEEKHRDSMLRVIITFASQNENSRWYVQDSGLDEKPKFEHLRSLVELSASVDPNAQLMFVNNVDMMHPLRIVVFQEGKKDVGLPRECPFRLSGKLLLNEKVTAIEGQLGRLISNTQDFDLWKQDGELNPKIQLATNSKCKELDAEEFFDFMVPTAIMEKFFRLNPEYVSTSRYCDKRLMAILKFVGPIEVADIPQYPWLIACYKSTVDNNNVHKANDKDKKLAQKYDIPKADIAKIRTDIEALMMQHFGWNDYMYKKLMKQKIKDLNKLYSSGFGEDLWAQVLAKVESYFNKAVLEESKDAWECLQTKQSSCIIS